MEHSLICIKPLVAHWGDILIVGKEYEIMHTNIVSTEIITEYENWIAHHPVGLQPIGEKFDFSKYTKRVDMPFVTLFVQDGSYKQFCTLSEEEVFELGADRNRNGKPAFGYSVYMVDDYFEYRQVRRDNAIDKIID